jgi:hypothetical protein
MPSKLKEAALLAALATGLGTVVGGTASPALATTCNLGGPPSQLYCASSTFSTDGGWTNTMATIEEQASPGGGPGQPVTNWVGIYQLTDQPSWTLACSQTCPNSVSCSAIFDTQQALVPSQLHWVVFAATGAGQVVPGSLQSGSF